MLTRTIYSESYGKDIELREVSREEAWKHWGNFTIYFEKSDGTIAHRCWHEEILIKGFHHWHVFPEPEDEDVVRYFLKTF